MANRVGELICQVYRGTESTMSFEVNHCTGGCDSDLTGKVAIVRLDAPGSSFVWRSDDSSQQVVTVPTPTDGVIDFVMLDSETTLLTAHQYRLRVLVESSSGDTTLLIDGILQVSE